MKLNIIIIIIVLALSTNAYAAGKIRIAYFNFPPHINYVNQRPIGALVDYWEKYLAPEMKVKIEWAGPLPPVRIFKMLENGDVNCMAFLAKNPERAKKYDYPELPFTSMKGAVAILKERNIVEIKSIADLNNLELCFFKDGFIPPTMQSANIRWDLLYNSKWRKLCLSKLTVKRIDAVFEPDRCALEYELVKEPKYRENIIVLDIPETHSFLYSLFSKVDNGKFLNLYNEVHMMLLENDRYIYKNLMKSFFERSE